MSEKDKLFTIDPDGTITDESAKNAEVIILEGVTAVFGQKLKIGATYTPEQADIVKQALKEQSETEKKKDELVSPSNIISIDTARSVDENADIAQRERARNAAKLQPNARLVAEFDRKREQKAQERAFSTKIRAGVALALVGVFSVATLYGGYRHVNPQTEITNPTRRPDGSAAPGLVDYQTRELRNASHYIRP